LMVISDILAPDQGALQIKQYRSRIAVNRETSKSSLMRSRRPWSILRVAT
jgi:hypothetical protein